MSQGIFGIVDFSKSIENPLKLLRATNMFRDPIGSGQLSYITNENYLFGMKRICDRSISQQAEIVKNKDIKVACLIHGEFNNYHELLIECLGETGRPCGDLELAIYLYSKYGDGFATKLNGLFSLGILDETNSSLILMNDRFGMAHQVYWTLIGSRFYFASHLKDLIFLSKIEKIIDFEALNLFLKYSYIPSPWAIFKGIRKLPAGHMLLFKDGKVRVNSYWEFRIPDGSLTDMEEAVYRYKDLLRKSLVRRLAGNKQAGILLSGGLDSSANVALAAECTGRKLKTFSVGFEDPVFDERPYARIVSDRFNTDHYETVVTGDKIEDLPKLIWHLEEPYFEFGLFLTYIGLAAARKEVDTVIGGEGADQLFGTGGFAGGRPAAMRYLLLKSGLLRAAQGFSRVLKGNYFYDNDNLAFKFRLFWQRAIDLNNWYFYGYDEHELLNLYRDPNLAIIPRIFPDAPGGESDALRPTPSLQPASFPDLYLETQLNQDLKHYVNENVMVKSGRMASMLGLTLRESYLDSEVTDFLTSLQFPMKRSGGLIDHLRGKIRSKYLHRKAMEGLLPPEIMKKPKQGGFVPVMIFLKDPAIRKRIYHNLLGSEIIKEYFRVDHLKKLFQTYESMQERKIYWYNFHNVKANQILFLLTFDIWNHFYLNNGLSEIIPPSLSDYLS